MKIENRLPSKTFVFSEAGTGIKAGWGILTLFNGITAKWIICLRIAVGFHSTEEKAVTAEIRKGTLILGKHIEPEKKEEKKCPTCGRNEV
ncbi:Uncharacterised protein [Candidatus Anstonella stagnisolia]|nr:Uncharacterised protein [Candidatus Anstonella stagnisolia]